MIFNWRLWVGIAVASVGLSGLGFAIAWILVSPPADFFRARYFEFALPRGWHCDIKGSETVCEPPGDPPHNAIIILAAKERNITDGRDDYLEYLKNNKTWTYQGDEEPVTSEVVYYQKANIGGYEWIDALHRNSEVKGYYTRYLVTVTSHLGLAVTFSAHSEWFQSWNREFEASIATLRIYQSPSPFN